MRRAAGCSRIERFGAALTGVRFAAMLARLSYWKALGLI